MITNTCFDPIGANREVTDAYWFEIAFVISKPLNKDINLVDPASSHTLVSKIKPCMSKYKQFCTVKLRMAHYISYSLLDSTLLLG